MSYCLNPHCPCPQNAAAAKFCHCGAELLLACRYRALRLLGQGGFGRTLLAEDETQPSELCVIKQFYLTEESLIGQSLGRKNHLAQTAALFEQEAMWLKQLGNHEQIPSLLAYFQQDDRYYIVQEFIDGDNLALELKQEGVFSEAQIRDLLNDLLPVLQFVHQEQVIHRDIKPENVIRRRSDRKLVLVDFGAAQYVVPTKAKTGTTIGSAGYAAPEQLQGKALFASDLYSLGITCIQLLTRVDPFDLYDPIENACIWRQYLHDNPISEELGQILDKMIQAKVKQRYQSADQVLAVLKLAIAPAALPLTASPLQPSWDCINTLTVQANPVCSLVFSPDGWTLASGGMGKAIKLWQVKSGKELYTLNNGLLSRFGLVCSVAFSPDGQLLASCSFDRTIRLWQVDTGKKVRSLGGLFSGHSDYVYSVAFSPDGQSLASCSFDRTIRLWQVNTGRELSRLGDRFADFVAFGAGGRMLALGSTKNTIQVWQVGNGGEICTPISHSSTTRSAVFSPDGSMLAIGSADHTLRLWQVSSGAQMRFLHGWSSGHFDSVCSLAFSPNGQVLASGSADHTIKLWQVSTGRELCTLIGHADSVSSIAFNPDGQTLASGSRDGMIKIWHCSRFSED